MNLDLFKRVTSSAARRRGRTAVAAAVTVLGVSALIVPNAAAYPDTSLYRTVLDAQGVDDVPGQKDLTEQGWKSDDETVDVFFNFDDIVNKGGNTLDGCTLFDSDDDGFVNFAMCGTVGARDTTTPQASVLFSCKDVRVDRCANGAVVTAPARSAGTTCAHVDKAASAAFGSDRDADTRVYCTVVLDDVGAEAAELVNTCAYSSNEPNSDPADCVLAPAKARPTATGTTSVIPNASISITGWASGGNSSGDLDKVIFALYDSADCSTTAIYTETLAAGGSVSTTNVGSTVLTVNGTYNWKVVYTGNNLNDPFELTCGTIRTTVDLYPVAIG